jgi:hypothetical protein
MLWQRAPIPNAGQEQAKLAGGLSKELLRRICEPFFEQMLVALQDVLCQSSYMVGQDSFEPCYMHQPEGSEDQLSEEPEMGDVNEVDDLGAFSSVLLVDSSFPGGPPGFHAPGFLPQKRLDIGVPQKTDGDQEKSATAMVCRHWKSKGWCRLGDACKFSHPDHKCGVGAANGGGKSSSAAPGAAGENDQGRNSSGDEGGPADGSKKSSRRRRNKAKGPKAPQQLGEDGRNMQMFLPMPVTLPSNNSLRFQT